MNKSLQEQLSSVVKSKFENYYKIMGEPVQPKPAAWEYRVGDKVHLEKHKLDYFYIHDGKYVKGIPLYYD